MRIVVAGGREGKYNCEDSSSGREGREEGNEEYSSEKVGEGVRRRNNFGGIRGYNRGDVDDMVEGVSVMILKCQVSSGIRSGVRSELVTV